MMKTLKEYIIESLLDDERWYKINWVICDITKDLLKFQEIFDFK